MVRQESAGISDQSADGSVIENTCWVISKDKVRIGEFTEAAAGAAFCPELQ